MIFFVNIIPKRSKKHTQRKKAKLSLLHYNQNDMTHIFITQELSFYQTPFQKRIC